MQFQNNLDESRISCGTVLMPNSTQFYSNSLLHTQFCSIPLDSTQKLKQFHAILLNSTRKFCSIPLTPTQFHSVRLNIFLRPMVSLSMLSLLNKGSMTKNYSKYIPPSLHFVLLYKIIVNTIRILCLGKSIKTHKTPYILTLVLNKNVSRVFRYYPQQRLFKNMS